MTKDQSIDEFIDTMLELQQGIGDICVTWAGFEHQTELLLWQLLELSEDDGKLVTTKLDIRPRLEMLAALADRKIENTEAKERLAKALEIVTQVQPDRNLIVHGQWGLDVKQLEVWGHTQRGKYKDKPQKLTRKFLAQTRAKITESYILLAQVGIVLQDQENA